MCEHAQEAAWLLDSCEKDSSTTDNSEWMTKLPSDVYNQPFNQISIPGSHDSGAFWLDPSSPICPDESSTIRNLVKVFGSCAKNVVIRWSLTQHLAITDQLNHGIRYFDLRNGYLQPDDDIFFVHGIYGHRIEELLAAVNDFLHQHPKEVVILDFNHFYSFTNAIHSRFAKSIASMFQGKMLTPDKGAKCSLADIWKNKKQVIIVYDDVDVCKTYPEFWPGHSIYSPWPNTSSVGTLVAYLDKRFDSLKQNSFNVFQAILTPQTSTVVKHVLSSLKSYLCTKCDVAVAQWLSKIYDSKQRGVNIVICDFVSMDGCAGDVIKLNDIHKSTKSF